MPPARTSRRALAAVALLVPCAAAAQPTARAASTPAVWMEYAADDELERYLRSLQALGDVPLHPWSLRQFSPVELDRLRPRASAHPWRARLETRDTSGFRWALIRPGVATRYNSTFPYGGNDGAVWAGRGVTAAVSGGFAARWGALSLTVHPIAFWAQNQSFALFDNGRQGAERFGDPIYAHAIDRPQQFGAGAYARVDPGQSTARLDFLGVSLGLSTANLWWGPAQEFPFLLGNNAAGFQHAFVGTSGPANIGIGQLHTKLLWGRLEQSEYFNTDNPVARPRRFATGLLVSFSPRGLANLEIGAARFFHAPWPDEGLPNRYLTRPFEGLLKSSLPEVDQPIAGDSRSIDGENQLASIFARLVLPNTGFEIYGELGKEDHHWDLRHLLLSPDEQAAMTVGASKSWRRNSGIAVVRAEAINFQQRQVDRFKLGPAVYLHASGSNQGHTQRGQLLGADVGVGSSAGAIVAFDAISRTGRTTVEWRRVVRQEREGVGAAGPANSDVLDVIHTLGVERLLLRGGVDLLAGVDVSYNFNRDFQRDRANVSVRLALTGLPGRP